LIYGLAVILAIALIGEIDSEGMWRFIAALSIVVAAITLVIPILQRIGRMDSRQQDLLMPIDQRNVASIDAEISRLQQQIDKLQQVKTAIIESQGAAAVPQQTS
jgi:DNA-binding Lrp family transcriptional regulator